MASSQPTPIVTHLPADVKQLRDFSERRHIPVMDMVEVVKTIYPKYDKYLHSRCAHGEETGAMLRPDALKALMTHFAEDGKKTRPDRRQRQNRCQCRLTDTVFSQVQKRLQERGQTMQDYLEGLILKDLMEVRNGQNP